MAHSNDNCASNAANVFREAVCINTKRVYDSAADKDCIRDLPVMFTRCGQSVIDAATTIKTRSVEVIGVFFEVEAVDFHKGFFSVDMTFFFKVTVAAYTSPTSRPTLVEGLAVFSKKAILFGSDAGVKTFTTENSLSAGTLNSPIVSVQVVDPMVLACRVCDCPHNTVPQTFVPPEEIADQFEGEFGGFVPTRELRLTIGMFSIIMLERQVQILVPIYDFCVPGKESSTGVSATDDPCDLFDRIAFPTDEFFPPRLNDFCDDK
jgi:hypothetical protein